MPDPLPWILLPSSDAASANICCVVDGHALNHRVSVAQGARFFGADDGGWLFFALHQTHGHALLNLRTRHPELTTRAIPDQLSIWDAPRLENMTLLAATLSAPPDEEQLCFGSAIVIPWRFVSGPREVVFWRMGDTVAVDAGQVPHPHPCFHVEDLVYYHGAFYFLTRGEHFRVYKPSLGEDGSIKLNADIIVWFQPRQQEDGEHVVARYIVQSREKLLMVVRLGDPDSLVPTKSFKVYETEEVEKGGNAFYLWKQLDTLDDRVFFVGRGCSRAFGVPPYMRFGVNEGVYFLDDECFNDDAMMFEDQYDRLHEVWSERGGLFSG
jgi:hypothetical protein